MRDSHMKKDKAQLRRVEMCYVQKDHLLDILKAEALAPDTATKIIAIGHNPGYLTVTVTFD